MSAARDLAKLGNQDALTVDTTLTRVGINSSNPTATLDIDGTVQVGTGVTVYSASGIVSATKYYADSYYGSGVNLTGVGNTDNIITGTAATFNNKVNINSTLTCSEGINVSVGVITAPSASFSGNVTIGGTLTYEDVTDIDAVGLITARTGVRVTAGGLVVTAGVSTFSAPVNINSSPNFSEGLNVSAGVATFAGNQTVAGTATFSKKTTVNATLDATEGLHVSAGVVTAAGEFRVGSAVTIGSAGVSTFSSGVKLAPNSGLLVEGISSTATAWSSTNDLNLDNGMIQFCSANLAGTNNTLDIYSSVGINTQMKDNDMIIVTGITSVSATTAFVNAVTIDGIAQQVAWVGGSAPTDGGGSGFDTYTFNIWKVGNAKFNIIGNQVTTS